MFVCVRWAFVCTCLPEVKLEESKECGREWKIAYRKTCRLVEKNAGRPWNLQENSFCCELPMPSSDMDKEA
eukprot:3953363-Amphidinium_carterae.1